MAEYHFYIDDSGTKEYAGEGEEYSARGGKSRHFIFGGVLVSEAVAGTFAADIAATKRLFFGTADVEIKSTWLRNPAQREKRYLSRYGLSEQALTNFVSEYYEIVGKADLQLIAAVVDKEHVQEVYKGKPLWYAPAIAYDVLLQRVVQQVRTPDAVHIHIDDMTGATPHGNQYKANLKSHHRQLVATGSRLLKGLDWSALKGEPRFVNSAHSHLIQVADIVSYNVYRQFLEHGEAWEEATEELATYEWFLKLGRKFRQGEKGRIQGYGVVKFPLRNRVPWAYADK